MYACSSGIEEGSLFDWPSINFWLRPPLTFGCTKEERHETHVHEAVQGLLLGGHELPRVRPQRRRRRVPPHGRDDLGDAEALRRRSDRLDVTAVDADRRCRMSQLLLTMLLLCKARREINSSVSPGARWVMWHVVLTSLHETWDGHLADICMFSFPVELSFHSFAPSHFSSSSLDGAGCVAELVHIDQNIKTKDAFDPARTCPATVTVSIPPPPQQQDAYIPRLPSQHNRANNRTTTAASKRQQRQQ